MSDQSGAGNGGSGLPDQSGTVNGGDRVFSDSDTPSESEGVTYESDVPSESDVPPLSEHIIRAPEVKSTTIPVIEDMKIYCEEMAVPGNDTLP